MKHPYDIVIIGGGMVGATLGCALGGSPLRVAVVEGEFPPAFSPDQPPDLRVSAVSIASASIFNVIGAWQGISSRRCCPFRRMRVWEDTGDVEFRSQDIHESVLGYIVENRIIQLALLERLAAFDNVDLLCPANSRDIDYAAGGSTLSLDDGTSIGGRLVDPIDFT